MEKLDQTQWDESDSEPLAKVFQPMNNDGDLSYQPSSGTSSSDDNSPDHNERKTRRLRHSKTIRNAKSASVHQALLLEKERLTHATRLDNLLLANGLRRVDVPADGNCFFEACATTLQHLHADDIRRCLCCYLEENFALFAEFLSVSDQVDPNERYLQYFQNVEELRQPGKWSNDAADMLPLALASWTNQTVRIYSSSPVCPVVDIHPVTDQESDDKIINLALLEFQNAAITHAKQNTPIYTPSGWDIILRMAWRRKTYTVVPLTHHSTTSRKSQRYLFTTPG